MIYAIQWVFWIGLYYVASRVLLVAADVFVHGTDPTYAHRDGDTPWVLYYALPAVGEFWLLASPFTTASKVLSWVTSRMLSFKEKRARRREARAEIAYKLQAIEDVKQQRLLRELDEELRREQRADSWKNK